MIELPSIPIGLLIPEIVLAVGALLILIVDAGGRHGRASWGLALLVVGVAAVAALVCGIGREPIGGGMLAVDGFTRFMRVLLLGSTGAVLLMAPDYAQRFRLHTGEFYALVLFSSLGALLMAAAGDLVIVFLGLEVHSIALYVLAGFRRDRPGEESCLKYLLLGAFASAFLLYGIALLYGAAGTTNLHDLGLVIGVAGEISRGLLFAGMALIAVGLGFKIAAVPFHMWTPDVYEGAPTVVTGFMAVVPKAGAFAAILRVFLTGLSPLVADWQVLWSVLAVLTMILGNVLAVVQRNLKRLLAYSSIAHAGYLLVGLAAGDVLGASGILFYLVAYALMNLGAFAVVTIFEREGRGAMLEDYAGLVQERPLLGSALAVFMFSLAGIPPTAGFMGKFYLFGAAVRAGLTPLTVIAVLTSVIGVYYYLRVVVTVVFREPDVAWTRSARTSWGPALAIGLALAGTLLFGILPAMLHDVAIAGSAALR
jgi:NADH-quinone oxidoreductase subunit N